LWIGSVGTQAYSVAGLRGIGFQEAAAGFHKSDGVAARVDYVVIERVLQNAGVATEQQDSCAWPVSTSVEGEALGSLLIMEVERNEPKGQIGPTAKDFGGCFGHVDRTVETTQ
jgi:hypothetical protein